MIYYVIREITQSELKLHSEDLGCVDNHTPKSTISVLKPQRKREIGTALMQAILRNLKLKGCSLAGYSAPPRGQL